VAAGNAGFPLDAQQPASDRVGSVAHLQARAAQGAEKFRQRRFVVGGNAQVAQLPLDGSGRSVCHARDAPTAEIQNGKRLQHVVELPGGERDGDFLVVAHAPQVFEVTDTVLIENHALDGQIG
jgi:hypothetical protein